MLVQSKFEEIRKSNQAAAQRLAERHMSSSSSSDDDDNDEDCEAAGNRSNEKKEKVLASTFNTYSDQTGEFQQVAGSVNMTGWRHLRVLLG